MRSMLKWLSRLFVLALLLGGAWWANQFLGWLPRPSAQQQAALAMMEAASPKPEGENALVNLLLFGLDVPETDYARWQQHGPEGLKKALQAAGYQSVLDAGEQPRCATAVLDCLAATLANPEAAREQRDRVQPLIDRLPRLYRSRHASINPLSAEFDPNEDIPEVMPAMQVAQVQAAMLFVDGDAAQAVYTICGEADFWRRMAGHTNSLIVKIAGNRFVVAAGEMLVQMQARSESPLPVSDECRQHFSPLDDDERDLCRSIRGEYAFVQSMMREQDRKRPWYRPPLDRPFLRGMAAYNDAQFCDAGRVARFRAGDATAFQAASCSQWDRLTDPISCAFLAIGLAPLPSYLQRIDDFDAQLAAVSSALAINLRGTDTSLQQAFEQRPDGPRRDEQQLQTDPDSHPALVLNPPDDSRRWQFSPLPLRADAATPEGPAN